MRNQGLTFLEILFSLIIFTIAMVGFFQIFNVALNAQHRAKQEIIAINLARGLTAEIMSKNFDDSVRELNRSNFDDVSDYNSYTDSPPVTIGGLPMNGAAGTPDYSGFRRTVNVVYCDVVGNIITEVAGPTNYKKATVTVNGPYVTNTVIDELKVNAIQ